MKKSLKLIFILFFIVFLLSWCNKKEEELVQENIETELNNEEKLINIESNINKKEPEIAKHSKIEDIMNVFWYKQIPPHLEPYSNKKIFISLKDINKIWILDISELWGKWSWIRLVNINRIIDKINNSEEKKENIEEKPKSLLNKFKKLSLEETEIDFTINILMEINETILYNKWNEDKFYMWFLGHIWDALQNNSTTEEEKVNLENLWFNFLDKTTQDKLFPTQQQSYLFFVIYISDKECIEIEGNCIWWYFYNEKEWYKNFFNIKDRWWKMLLNLIIKWIKETDNNFNLFLEKNG